MKKADPVGFPWLLVIQIVLAIISYLIQKSNNNRDKANLIGLRASLQSGFPEAKDLGVWND